MTELTGPLAALAAGIVTSLHCTGMCGPLACAACTSPCQKSSNAPVALYHLGRLASYASAGTVAGLLGSKVLAPFLTGATRGMAWIFALFFLAVVLGLDKFIRLPLPPGVLSRALSQGGPKARAAALGLLTPLLPCAPLYLVIAAAAIAGSPLDGAILLAAFGLGTIPLLFVVQNRFVWLQTRFSPRAMDLTRRALALASVVLLVTRATFTASTGCPMCH
ncbi:MAG: sulfite exporter TauE/SafE family protein [Terrimicrobiaceae bacterium]|nr:sulfite exporter TauE/SafE family protein [Terrimicrobiaceae bacterium]